MSTREYKPPKNKKDAVKGSSSDSHSDMNNSLIAGSEALLLENKREEINKLLDQVRDKCAQSDLIASEPDLQNDIHSMRILVEASTTPMKHLLEIEKYLRDLLTQIENNTSPLADLNSNVSKLETMTNSEKLQVTVEDLRDMSENDLKYIYDHLSYFDHSVTGVVLKKFNGDIQAGEVVNTVKEKKPQDMTDADTQALTIDRVKSMHINDRDYLLKHNALVSDDVRDFLLKYANEEMIKEKGFGFNGDTPFDQMKSLNVDDVTRMTLDDMKFVLNKPQRFADDVVAKVRESIDSKKPRFNFTENNLTNLSVDGFKELSKADQELIKREHLNDISDALKDAIEQTSDSNIIPNDRRFVAQFGDEEVNAEIVRVQGILDAQTYKNLPLTEIRKRHLEEYLSMLNDEKQKRLSGGAEAHPHTPGDSHTVYGSSFYIEGYKTWKEQNGGTYTTMEDAIREINKLKIGAQEFDVSLNSERDAVAYYKGIYGEFDVSNYQEFINSAPENLKEEYEKYVKLARQLGTKGTHDKPATGKEAKLESMQSAVRKKCTDADLLLNSLNMGTLHTKEQEKGFFKAKIRDFGTWYRKQSMFSKLTIGIGVGAAAAVGAALLLPATATASVVGAATISAALSAMGVYSGLAGAAANYTERRYAKNSSDYAKKEGSDDLARLHDKQEKIAKYRQWLSTGSAVLSTASFGFGAGFFGNIASKTVAVGNIAVSLFAKQKEAAGIQTLFLGLSFISPWLAEQVSGWYGGGGSGASASAGGSDAKLPAGFTNGKGFDNHSVPGSGNGGNGGFGINPDAVPHGGGKEFLSGEILMGRRGLGGTFGQDDLRNLYSHGGRVGINENGITRYLSLKEALTGYGAEGGVHDQYHHPTGTKILVDNPNNVLLHPRSDVPWDGNGRGGSGKPSIPGTGKPPTEIPPVTPKPPENTIILPVQPAQPNLNIKNGYKDFTDILYPLFNDERTTIFNSTNTGKMIETLRGMTAQDVLDGTSLWGAFQGSQGDMVDAFNRLFGDNAGQYNSELFNRILTANPTKNMDTILHAIFDKGATPTEANNAMLEILNTNKGKITETFGQTVIPTSSTDNNPSNSNAYTK